MKIIGLLSHPRSEAVSQAAVDTAGGTEVVALAGGFETAPALLLDALMRGAGRAIYLCADTLSVEAVADLARSETAGIVLLDGDPLAERFAASLSGATRWPALYGALEIGISASGAEFVCEALNRRARVAPSGPVIVCLHRDTGPATMPPIPQIIAAKKLEERIEYRSLDDVAEPVATTAKNEVKMCASLDELAVALIGTREALEARYFPKHPSLTVSEQSESNDTPTLGAARVVVAAGRGIGSRDVFDKLVRPLAATLGGAAGAAGGAVVTGIADAGVLVGQSGASVAPDIYVTLGISGADQHTGGVAESATVFAVSEDPQARIFSHADFGYVGNAVDAAAFLLDAVKARPPFG